MDSCAGLWIPSLRRCDGLVRTRRVCYLLVVELIRIYDEQADVQPVQQFALEQLYLSLSMGELSSFP